MYDVMDWIHGNKLLLFKWKKMKNKLLQNIHHGITNFGTRCGLYW